MLPGSPAPENGKPGPERARHRPLGYGFQFRSGPCERTRMEVPANARRLGVAARTALEKPVRHRLPTNARPDDARPGPTTEEDLAMPQGRRMVLRGNR